MDETRRSSLPYDAEDEEELYHEMLKVASANECTGMIPAAPASRAEVDSYSEIYDIPLSRDAKRANHGYQDANGRHPESTPLPPSGKPEG